MRPLSALRWTFLALALSFAAFAVSAAQTAAPAAASAAPTIQLLSYTDYPSMMPVTAIRVHLSSTFAIRDLVDQAIGKGWDCTKISSYTVAVQGSKRHVAIANLRLEPSPTCTAGDSAQPDVVIVLNDHSLTTSDSLTVALANLPAGLTASPSAAAKVPTATSGYALTLTPQAAPGEALTSGAKRDVGQLSIAFTAPEVAPVFHKAAIYLSTTDLFSTDERDSKGAFAGAVGIKHGWLSRWYTPVSLQESMQGNQTATNLSSVTTGTFATIVPWSWNKSFLYNGGIQAPSPPEITINASYTHRINQLVTKTSPALATDDFSLNPYATFSPIYLLPKACAWLQNKIQPPATSTTPPATTPSKAKQYCLGLQTDVGMWYLPLDLTKSGSQRAEGYGDVSILLPLSDIPFKSLGYLITGNTANTQLRIKYSDSVNAANNYARTRQWTFGFEVIK